MTLRLTREGFDRMMKKTYEAARAKYSAAGRLYSQVDQIKQVPIDGWAKQRAQWNEHDHRVRGAVSPLGGTAKGSKR